MSAECIRGSGAFFIPGTDLKKKTGMPGIKKKFNSWNESSNKDKLSDFVEKFWHYDVITSMGLEKFKDEYLLWAKEKKYHRSISKAEEVYK